MKKITMFVLLCCSIFTVAAQEKRPVIGIVDTYRDGVCYVSRTYIEAVLTAGGLPVVMPLMRNDSLIAELLRSVDGIIFPGGGDFDPAYYHEKPIPQMGSVNAPRDTFELRTIHLAADMGVPVLGICRGLQLINIAFGGTLYQDLPVQYHDKSVSHRQKKSNNEPSHSVIVEDSTVFARIVGEKILMVNSAHHQAVKRPADGFKVSGRAADGIVEAMEKIDSSRWILGVQFHPEQLVKDKSLLKIFQEFVDVTAKHRGAKIKKEALKEEQEEALATTE